MSGLKKYMKFSISVLLSVLILYFLYRKIDYYQFARIMSQINLTWFSVYLLLFFPQLLIACYRWNFLTNRIGKKQYSYYQSVQQVVGSYSANLIIPAKMGEFVRLLWLRKTDFKIPLLGLILVEKLWDVISLVLIAFVSFILLAVTNPDFRIPWLVFSGLLISGIIFLLLFKNFFLKKRSNIKSEKIKSFLVTFDLLWNNYRKELFRAFMISILLWIIQITQFYFIFLSLNTFIPLPYLFAGSSLAVLAGAIIFSIGGIGPRDAVIVWFFSSFAVSEILVSAGILSVLRIIIPALAGLPFFFNLTRKSF